MYRIFALTGAVVLLCVPLLPADKKDKSDKHWKQGQKSAEKDWKKFRKAEEKYRKGQEKWSAPGRYYYDWDDDDYDTSPRYYSGRPTYRYYYDAPRYYEGRYDDDDDYYDRRAYRYYYEPAPYYRR